MSFAHTAMPQGNISVSESNINFEGQYQRALTRSLRSSYDGVTNRGRS